MNKLTASHKDLQRELADFGDRFPKLQDDELFVLWFLRAFVTEDEQQATAGLCGGAHDKGIDAVLIDDPTRNVFIVQGKYRETVATKNEHRNDITGFARLALDLCGDIKSFTSLAKDISPDVRRRLEDARNRIKQRGYRLQLLYITMGKCSQNLADEAKRIVRRADCPTSIQVINGRQTLLLFSDYLDGVAPPVPSLDLEIESGQGVQVSGVLQRYDSKTDIESWIFSITDQAVAEMYQRSGTRLFARNVRGFLGNTDINKGMETTLAREPEFFWYYNNGITIVCDYAERVSRSGRDVLRLMNPQIINGQQTTRTLARQVSDKPRASVLVRVIRVPRSADGNSNHFETLVSRIVSATNWQNAIRPSDLMSNDRRQIEIERQFRKLGYGYLRKRETKSEARQHSAGRHYYLIRKEEVAQAVAACDLDPATLRLGKDKLFEERMYMQVFPTADPYYYLNRFFLMREVGASASGYPERAYAKWLVVNFLWTHLEPLIRTRSNAETFRVSWERGKPSFDALNHATNSVFNAALKFYRLKRGKGSTAIDVSTFFRLKRLHLDFDKFWRGSNNHARPSFSRAWNRFTKQLSAEG
jgi:hypothetical protein